ncbi:hypothetical protein ACFVWG_24120 [Kribbella sp. NPDC058245]|uniref:hypothetical protein n=1 Tax=Kribbella sp. NPDC058245 TaxID=3346399 RepID=UPI0036E4CCD7
MTATEVARLRDEIINCATANGIDVDEVQIFEEEVDRRSVELIGCIDTLLDADESYLIVPSLFHFAGFNNPLEVRRDLESRGITVLSARHAAPQHESEG